MILISGPGIAACSLRTRKWAHEHLRRGTFGRVTSLNGVLYAELPNVERALGKTITEAQLAQAAKGAPDRILTLATEEAA
jgi:hypothetical protein